MEDVRIGVSCCSTSACSKHQSRCLESAYGWYRSNFLTPTARVSGTTAPTLVCGLKSNAQLPLNGTLGTNTPVGRIDERPAKLEASTSNDKIS